MEIKKIARNEPCYFFLLVRELLSGGEFVFAYTAEWTNEIFSHLLPWSASRNTFGTNGWIILPTTYITYVLFHIIVVFIG